MKITINLIKSYNPCKSGIDNFEKLYLNYNNDLTHFLALPDISYSDKIWLATKVIDIKTLQQWSIECAENVIDNYNELYPNDNRIFVCIQTTKNYLNGVATLEELTAARSAAESAAWSVARSAESAAEKEQEDINLSILIALLENKK